MVVSVFEVVSYLNSEGEREFMTRRHGEDPYATTVGMLAWAQMRLMKQWDEEAPDER